MMKVKVTDEEKMMILELYDVCKSAGLDHLGTAKPDD